MMPIDFAISGAGDEAPILDFQRTNKHARWARLTVCGAPVRV
jgi:hypothetical protein